MVEPTNNIFLNEVEQLRENGLLRTPNLIPKDLINVSSTDYLGLGNDPRLIDAATIALKDYGSGGRARLLGGDIPIFAELESAVASLTGFDNALLFTSGYAANIGLLTAILSKSDTVFADHLIHASLIDGIRSSGAKLIRYSHCDVADLAEKYQKYDPKNKTYVVSDGLFSMDGTIVPINKIARFCKNVSATFIVDDAHGVGTLGNITGSGVVEQLKFGEKVDILTGSFGKALGSQGGFVACSDELRSFLVNKCRPFFFSVALSPAACGAALEAISIVRENDQPRVHLHGLARSFRANLSSGPYQITGTDESPIVGLIVGDVRQTSCLSNHLKRHGFFAAPIRPPTVPAKKCRIRFGLSSSLQSETIDSLSKAILDFS